MQTTHRPRRSGSFRRSRGKSFGSSPRRGSATGRGFSRQSHNRGKQGNRRSRKMVTFNPSQFINTNPVEIINEVYTPQHSFEAFGLHEKILHNIAKLGITDPSPIQDKIIPDILAGKDVIGLAETGTGKTAAFLLPLIEQTIENPKHQTLILAPTRELAIQIQDELRKLSLGFSMFSATCVGGMNINPQIKALRYQNNFVIGTPGRILDLITRGFFNTAGIKTVVLDEADRMLDMGFIHDMRKILGSVSTNRQTLFFSATMTTEAKKLVNDFLKNPTEVSVKKKDVTNSIEQNVIPYEQDTKFETLLGEVSRPEYSRVMIFGSMKHSVEKLARQLSRAGVEADSIHGNKGHSQRQRALKRFKDGEAKVLVATDVAARGIHVDDVSHVINYDLPNTFEDYVHRIGRTGRSNKRGKALTFVPKY